jgi:hypothetical protein
MLGGFTDPPHHASQSLYASRTSPGNALLTLNLFEFADFLLTRNLLLGVKTEC